MKSKLIHFCRWFGVLVLLLCCETAKSEQVDSFVFSPETSASDPYLKEAGQTMQSLLMEMKKQGYDFQFPWKVITSNNEQHPSNWYCPLLKDFQILIKDKTSRNRGVNTTNQDNDISTVVEEILLGNSFKTKNIDDLTTGKSKQAEFTVTNEILPLLTRLSCPNNSDLIPLNVEIFKRWSFALVSLLLFSNFIMFYWLNRNTQQRHDEQYSNIQRLGKSIVDLDIKIENFEKSQEQFNYSATQERRNILKSINDIHRPSLITDIPTSEQKDHSLPETKNLDIEPLWLNIFNGHTKLDQDNWRILAVELENFASRKGVLLPPSWTILENTPSTLREASFWLVGRQNESYELLVPSQTFLNTRADWLSGGHSMINAFLHGIYTWEAGQEFIAHKLARIKYDEITNEIIVITQGHLTLERPS